MIVHHYTVIVLTVQKKTQFSGTAFLFRDADEGADASAGMLERSGNIEAIKEGAFKIIYAHPETLIESKDLAKILRSRVYRDNVCCTVVDEVHMISEWYVS